MALQPNPYQCAARAVVFHFLAGSAAMTDPRLPEVLGARMHDAVHWISALVVEALRDGHLPPAPTPACGSASQAPERPRPLAYGMAELPPAFGIAKPPPPVHPPVCFRLPPRPPSPPRHHKWSRSRRRRSRSQCRSRSLRRRSPRNCSGNRQRHRDNSKQKKPGKRGGRLVKERRSAARERAGFCAHLRERAEQLAQHGLDSVEEHAAPIGTRAVRPRPQPKVAAKVQRRPVPPDEGERCWPQVEEEEEACGVPEEEEEAYGVPEEEEEAHGVPEQEEEEAHGAPEGHEVLEDEYGEPWKVEAEVEEHDDQRQCARWSRKQTMQGLILRMLRHGHYGTCMDFEGWVPVRELVRNKCLHNVHATLSDLQLVAEGSAGRIELSADRAWIRCTRGHTVPGVHGLRVQVSGRDLPPVLYHCTTADATVQILDKQQGIKTSNRGNVVYMSTLPLQSAKRPVCLMVHIRRLLKTEPACNFWWASSPSCGIVIVDSHIPWTCVARGDD